MRLSAGGAVGSISDGAKPSTSSMTMVGVAADAAAGEGEIVSSDNASANPALPVVNTRHPPPAARSATPRCPKHDLRSAAVYRTSPQDTSVAIEDSGLGL